MTRKQIDQATRRAYRAAKKFREAAINANAIVETYSERRGSASRRLRDFGELSIALALDLLLEQQTKL